MAISDLRLAPAATLLILSTGCGYLGSARDFDPGEFSRDPRWVRVGNVPLVLQHVREVAHICGVMAAELKMDTKLAKRCGVFHDIGKAVDQEFEGSHPVIGGELLKRFEEPKEVVDAAANHHNDADARFPYTVLAAAADAISASRPGARSENLDRYVKRLEQLEAIAKGMAGVTGAYAIQAGREVRVLVDSDKINDGQALVVARDIAKSIEQQMTYPGEIRVTVLRETRVVEYAR